jgi:hypothetical protein
MDLDFDFCECLLAGQHVDFLQQGFSLIHILMHSDCGHDKVRRAFSVASLASFILEERRFHCIDCHCTMQMCDI